MGFMGVSESASQRVSESARGRVGELASWRVGESASQRVGELTSWRSAGRWVNDQINPPNEFGVWYRKHAKACYDTS
ncbi:MAG: hypothetical protein KKD28_13915 [Chloroflexi bacterium]|nr:hypothetical protein [Chloroflexota bacterium]